MSNCRRLFRLYTRRLQSRQYGFFVLPHDTVDTYIFHALNLRDLTRIAELNTRANSWNLPNNHNFISTEYHRPGKYTNLKCGEFSTQENPEIKTLRKYSVLQYLKNQYS